MTTLTWSNLNPRYNAGVDHGVLYLPGKPGVVWNGLVNVSDVTPSPESNRYYFEGALHDIWSQEADFMLKISAWTYPTSFEVCMGLSGYADNQRKMPFGFSYRTSGSSDQLHLVYNAVVENDETDYSTVGVEVDPALFEWTVSTKPTEFFGMRQSAHAILDLGETYSGVQTELMKVLYGTSTTAPRLPTIDELFEIYDENAIFVVIDNGDGTWTARGPDSYIQMLSGTMFQITSPTAKVINETTYEISTDL